MKSNTAYLMSLGRGATFKEISKSIVESIQIPLPPLDEQRRIARALDHASSIQRLAKRRVEMIDVMEGVVFQAAFGREFATWSHAKLGDLLSSIEAEAALSAPIVLRMMVSGRY